MKLVYIVGPYRAPTTWGIECNIHKARVTAAEMVQQLSSLWIFPITLASDEYYLEGTLELLRRCDAVFLLPDWEKSSGSYGEKEEAERLGIPIFYRIEELKFWVQEQKIHHPVHAHNLGGEPT